MVARIAVTPASAPDGRICMRGALRAGCGAALMGLSLVAIPGTASAARAPVCTPVPAQADEAQMQRLITAQRRVEKVPKVKGNVALRKAGRAKSIAMAKGGRFAHESVLPWADGRSGGQNIAMAATADVAFQAMLESPGHHANIVGRDWRFTGVGAARGCDGLVYFTLNFLGR